MKAVDKDKHLEELIWAAIGKGRTPFDFQQWQREHKGSVEQFRSQPEPRISRPPRSFAHYLDLHRRPAVGLVAAAAVLVIAVLFLAGDGQRTLCAQALKVIEQARTLHVTTREYRNGQPVRDHELWYDRGAGMMEQERYESRTDMRIDNGRYEWRYAKGGKYVGRQRSYRDNSELVTDLCAAWQDCHPRCVQSGDTRVGGIPCRMYVITDSERTWSLWADEKSRVRRADQTRKGPAGEGETRISMEIEYDVPIAPQRFEPSFDPNMEIIDPRQLIEQQYPLDTALFTRETLAFTFAVHRLELCREGYKYLVCSHRLTDRMRRRIDAHHPWTFYGSAELREVPGNWSGDRVVLLARMRHDGIYVAWYLLLPSAGQKSQTAGCDVEVDVSAANQLEERLKADGSPTREKFRLVIPKEKVQPTPALLADFLGDLYALGEQFDPVVHSFLLTEVTEVLAWRRPGIQFSKEQYIGDVEQRVKNRLRHD